ncbi:hypothetical protein LOTGIDRAFT_238795 [Lottia gigantea]|uniref:SUEL-type lectin domain-containing protein n=1 Tax=Lottia gigantea TaxID=225164 RepID=V4B0G6_LOTGI|nr:hypothetical protein LOTGIDRAFT_238795 [Lottia gigantea]ESO99576.1 hypothetical protein LOTGIDRAFT_238795 [Lottia gigantea]
MIRHILIHIGILAGFVWCSDLPYSDYLNCQQTISDDSCYSGNAVFKSWHRADINIYSNTENLCRFKTEYIHLIYCKNNHLRRCLPNARTKDMFKTADAEEKGFEHICSKPEAMNITCLKRSGQEIGDCQSEAKLGRLSINATFVEWKEYRCRSITATYECTQDSRLLKDCPESRSIYLEYSRITYPKACGDLSVSNGNCSLYRVHKPIVDRRTDMGDDNIRQHYNVDV